MRRESGRPRARKVDRGARCPGQRPRGSIAECAGSAGALISRSEMTTLEYLGRRSGRRRAEILICEPTLTLIDMMSIIFIDTTSMELAHGRPQSVHYRHRTRPPQSVVERTATYGQGDRRPAVWGSQRLGDRDRAEADSAAGRKGPRRARPTWTGALFLDPRDARRGRRHAIAGTCRKAV